MNQKKIGGTKKKVTDALAMLLMIIVFCAFMFPFVMVIINSLKQKRDIIKSPFSWLFTIKGLSFDNFVKAFNQMNFLNAFKNSLVVTVTATVLVTVLAAMLAYYIVRNVNVFSNIIFALMVASMIIPFQAIMIPLVSVYGGTLNISTMVIMNAMAFWNDFLLPSLVLTDKKLLTLPLSTYSFYGTYSADYGTIMAGLLLCVIPILILYVALQKQIINGVVAGAVK